jgi:hypothetical protein
VAHRGPRLRDQVPHAPPGESALANQPPAPCCSDPIRLPWLSFFKCGHKLVVWIWNGDFFRCNCVSDVPCCVAGMRRFG